MNVLQHTRNERNPCLKQNRPDCSNRDNLLTTACAGGWSSMLNILALASVILRPIFSLYPNVDFPLQTLLHRVVMPKLSQAKGNDSGSQINKINI